MRLRKYLIEDKTITVRKKGSASLSSHESEDSIKLRSLCRRVGAYGYDHDKREAYWDCHASPGQISRIKKEFGKNNVEIWEETR